MNKSKLFAEEGKKNLRRDINDYFKQKDEHQAEIQKQMQAYTEYFKTREVCQMFSEEGLYDFTEEGLKTMCDDDRCDDYDPCFL